ncbi:MAG: zinc ribbon domain-containing protein [Acidobacteria bacterium]|nr:zinc ribbon domain-containing protein [Acidobacteriota bacterium]
MFCSKCGTEIVGNFCPNCGTSVVPQPPLTAKKTGSKGKFMLGCLGLIVLAIIFSYFMANRSQNTQDSSNLKATVTREGATFFITNNDAFDWNSVELELNHWGLRTEGYFAYLPKLKSGEMTQVGGFEFAKKDGTRFNPFNTKIQKLRIYAKTPSGSATFAEYFDPSAL